MVVSAGFIISRNNVSSDGTAYTIQDGDGLDSDACTHGECSAVPYTPSTTAYNIKAKYDAKCGAPSAGSPKVFFKYFYVNTATGEKSGDVLAQAKLTSE